MFFHRTSFQEPIAKTGFLVSLTSYVCFWFLDVVRPGFVSRYVSVHIFLIFAIVFGVWWATVVKEYIDRIRLQRLLLIVFGIAIALFIWNTGVVFGGWRIPLGLFGLFVPVLTWRLIKYK